jgi:type IV pilus assembly protein PilM
MFFSSKKSVLGIDIGTTSIKIVQLTHSDGKHFLDTYGIVDVSFDIDERQEENIQKTVSVLKALLQKSGVTTKKMMASLPTSVVFTTVIDFPKMRDDELQNAVEFEAKKYVPLPLDQVTLSWVAAPSEDPDKNRVLITAVPNNVLKGYLRIFELANLQPLAVEIESLSLMRALVGSNASATLLVDLGAKTTHLDIIEQGNLVLTRTIPVGGETITQLIASSLTISTTRAEQFKKEFGMNQSPVIPEMIKPVLAGIKQEILQVQNIYRARNKSFDRIVLVGGGANLPGFAEYLSDIGPKVVQGDPLSQLTYSAELSPILKQYSANLSVAIGLALRTNS